MGVRNNQEFHANFKNNLICFLLQALNDQNSKLKDKHDKELKLKESEIKRLEFKLKTTPLESKFSKSQPAVDANKLKEYEEQINSK